MKPQATAVSTEARFWKKVRKTDDCWEWTGSRSVKGYGNFSINGRFIRASRYSYELHFGPIQDGLFVCHRCDNPTCVRPDHLFLGTNSQNIRDCVEKGRNTSGTQPFRLTDDQVREIRSAHGPLGYTKLAAAYGVTRAAIRDVVKRRSYPDVA